MPMRRPLEWQDSATLLGRLGSATAALDRQTLERIQELTDTAPGVLRRMHLESLAPPSLLKVSLKRFEINQLIDTFVAQMSTDQYASRRWSELQLQLLPALPKWPAGKVLTVADDTGNRLAHYASVMWPATSHINPTSSVVEQGKLLDAVLLALSDSQVRALLGNDLPAPGGTGPQTGPGIGQSCAGQQTSGLREVVWAFQYLVCGRSFAHRT